MDLDLELHTGREGGGPKYPLLYNPCSVSTPEKGDPQAP